MIQHWMSAVEVDEDSFQEDACLFMCHAFCSAQLMRTSIFLIFRTFYALILQTKCFQALQALTSRQQVALEEKIAALNVERDVSDLGYVLTL